MAALAVVITVGAVTVLVAALVVAPPLFRQHLARTGEDDPAVLRHAEEAFASAFAIALGVGVLSALVAAGLVSWFLVRRVAHPVVALSDAADAVAAGDYRVTIPAAGFADELQRLADAFGQMANRLADTESSRTRLLADLTHEIRTPLGTLEAYIDAMEDGVVVTSAGSWETMRGQVRRLRRLTDDLRDIVAADEHALGLVLTDVDPTDVAADATAAAGPRFQAKGVALVLDPAATTPWVRADRERLGQVLVNLLDNALRHTPAGGVVTVHVASDADRVRVSVSDTGVGLPADELDAVFERFRRGDPARATTDGGGSGLGLTIARAIVTEHGGTITARSDGTGRGATFEVLLPRAPAPR